MPVLKIYPKFVYLLVLKQIASKFEWCGVEEVGSGSFSYVKNDTKLKCRMVVFFY
jgi:hypothetical protein